jgi:hypothetical protein
MDSRSRAAAVGATVLAIGSAPELTIPDEVAHHDFAGRFAEPEEPRCLMDVKRQAWHFRIGAKNQAHDVWSCRFGIPTSCRTSPLELA